MCMICFSEALSAAPAIQVMGKFYRCQCLNLPVYLCLTNLRSETPSFTSEVLDIIITPLLMVGMYMCALA